MLEYITSIQHPKIIEKVAEDNFLVEPMKTWQVETDRDR